MKWSTDFLPEAKNDLKKLSGNQRSVVAKAITRVEKILCPAMKEVTEFHLGTRELTTSQIIWKLNCVVPGFV